LYAALVEALGEALPQSRKLAARALGKLGDARAEGPLIEALGRAPVLEQKSIVDALAVLGAEASQVALEALSPSDEDLARRRERARLMIERRLARVQPAQLDFDQALAHPCKVVLWCRTGLAEVLAAELAGRWAPRVVAPNRVEIMHRGTLTELLVARTAIEVGLSVTLDAATGGEPVERIAGALTRPETVALFQSWTRGAPRFRIAWTEPGHRRALTWALARAVRERTTAVMNDSHQAPWTLRAPPEGNTELYLVPRLDPDPRFAYRVSAVPAASHPSIAAALARIAGVQVDEIVWDPFVGSGLELVERARLGPARELWGSDLDPRALDAARANLAAAGLPLTHLVVGNALELAPPGVSLIITNPPMGRRVARDGSVTELLEGFVRHAARVLRPSGRLVWLSPLEQKTERVARALGLRVTAGPNVDLGGFSARVQTFVRPA
jgi:predicted RNA methylase